MNKLLSLGFWNALAGWILRNRISVISLVILATIFFASQWKYMRFSYTEANLLPDDHFINVQYRNFLDKFGDEGNLIVIATTDQEIFTPQKFKHWVQLTDTLQTFDEVEYSIGLPNLKILEKNAEEKRFEIVNAFDLSQKNNAKALQEYQQLLFEELPFYQGIAFSKKNYTIQTAVYIKKEIVNEKERKNFVLNNLRPLMNEFQKETGIEVKVSGMPYIRTLNSQNIVDEIQWFVLAALGVTSLIFFFFFRSFRATLIAMVTVVIGVMWAFGTLGALGYEITVLTAIIPPLIIVIGIPNCVFLINKYQQEIKKHGNQAKSLQRVITKIGNATLMTNLTTASGFATFIFTQSELLSEFGIVASLNIVAIFLLSLLIIPVIYSYMPPPKEKHLKHLGNRWIESFVNWMVTTVKQRRVSIYIVSVTVLAVSIIGIYNIKISGSLLEDMPKKADFFKDIQFFEEEFEGIMPLEFMINTQRKNGVTKLTNLKKIEQLALQIEEIPELSSPLSVVDLAKYAKQTYYNSNPKYFDLPTRQETNFIMPYIKSLDELQEGTGTFVDSTGQYARLTTFMKDVGTEEMERIEAKLKPEIEKIFPPEQFEVIMTGKALIFQKGTRYLVKNLILSLGLAILLIALFMAWMFRSFRMIVISLVPNLLPLLMTAGMMGFLGIPIKPSTILVFSIAFGISVDDTIHFLAKYRQELKENHWKIKRSVYLSLRETAVSMFYTSIVLFFGFSVFMISSFGGTVALGGLVSATLLFAMLANLLLLPSLLLSLERSIANKNTLKEPQMKLITSDQDLKEEQEKNEN
ncbi:efflux RND transporter permease subunit [Psychroflexus maritimus]|uniref:MMPL family transporter n=1 Tax=Psychroflexus maritimus TaxID=2714865 RepID=A0A967DZ09_9FLAO|nr:efflux RND transporter permease subunit [Psychroflexus maritimus]NGZ89703.1 MMPL family transporter [Psychroflexus maritimus]